MSIGMAFKMAFKSIISNKVRSFLTMLGIIIGVASVIILVSMVQGVTNNISKTLESMGTNLINVNIQFWGSNRAVSMDELEALVNKYPDELAAVTPSITGQVTVKYAGENVRTNVEGVNEHYRTIRNTNVTAGRFLNALDIELRQNVVLIGQYIANELYKDENPVGKDIKINGNLFKVVGVIEQKSTAQEGSLDDRIIIPYTVAQRLLRNATIRFFSLSATSPDTVDKAMERLTDFLYKKFNNENAYRIYNQADMLSQVDSVMTNMMLLLGGIAGISLLVGGIGIMNIMLVSVTERTREIGIRKAIGAKRRSILAQFLIESIVVSCFGGILGIGLGMGISSVLNKAMNLERVFSLAAIIVAFTFSVAVGVFFGLYPANKASKLNPIDALRFE